MGREDDIRKFAQREVGGRRLDLENIECGSSDMAGLERIMQGVFSDESTAGAVHDADAFFAKGEAAGVEHVAGFIGERHMHADEVGLREEAVDILDKLDLEAAGAADGKIGIVGENAHAEGHGAAGKLRADAAHAENAEGFVVELDALVFFAVPASGFHAGIGLRDVASDTDKEGKGMLGGGDGIATGSVHDDDTTARCGIHIDIVHAHTGAADDLQVRSGLQNSGGDFGLAADDESREFRDDFDNLSLRQTGFDNNLESAAGGEFIDSTLGHGIGYENFGSGKGHFLFF